MLGLLVNITTEPTDTLREFGQRVCGHCRSLLPSQCSDEAVPQRALTVMGNILPHSVPAVEWICDHGGTELLLNYIKVSDCACVCVCVRWGWGVGGVIIRVEEMKGLGSPDWNVSLVGIHLQKQWVYCPKNDRADGLVCKARPVCKATLTNGLLLGRSEVLRSWRRYLWAVVNQTNSGTISTATLGKLTRDGVECTWAFLSAQIPS